jgi:membrane-associated protease RseP (regulator of RpoE activity)
MTDDETPATDDTPPADESAQASAGSDDDTTPPDGADADADATLPETEAAAPAAPVATAAPAAASTEERAGVFVPRWVAILVGGLVALLVVGGVGFALGRATDDDHDDRGAVVFRPGGPVSPGRGDDGGRPFPVPNPGGGNGSGPAVPGVPDVPRGGVLLGVAVEPSTGDASGARVAEVVPGSPAADAGIEVGDVITKVDDTSISDASELVSTIRSHESGDKVTITYERDGESHSTDVTLGGGSSSSANGGSQSSSSTS